VRLVQILYVYHSGMGKKDSTLYISEYNAFESRSYIYTRTEKQFRQRKD